ncbi:MAG: hypothetical protein AB1765_03850 [Candidatus Hydrogenedentota bacterium]
MDFNINNPNYSINSDISNQYLQINEGSNKDNKEEKKYEVKDVEVSEEFKVNPEDLVIKESVVRNIINLAAHIPPEENKDNKSVDIFS